MTKPKCQSTGSDPLRISG